MVNLRCYCDIKERAEALALALYKLKYVIFSDISAATVTTSDGGTAVMWKTDILLEDDKLEDVKAFMSTSGISKYYIIPGIEFVQSEV